MCITMRNREYFGDDVDEFRPERFMPQDPFYKKAKFAWSAFGLHRYGIIALIRFELLTHISAACVLDSLLLWLS